MVKYIIEVDGTIRHIYSDDYAELDLTLGTVDIKRASHVEPVDVSFDNRFPSESAWMADMMPVGGPVIGPFSTRAEALEAERAWLLANDIPEVKE